MTFIKDIHINAAKLKKSIVFPEATDSRILKAASILKRKKIVTPILVGVKSEIERIAKKNKISLSDIIIVNHINDSNFDKFAKQLYNLRKKKGLSELDARKLIIDPVYYATMLLHNGFVDGLVSGAIHSTANTLRPALQIIKTKPDIKIASSFFFMVLKSQIYLFSDCGFVVDPNSKELAEIAITTSESAKFFGIKPKVALLSFSTHGSAKHEMVSKVSDAVKILTRRKVNFPFDGELQLDAAIVPKIAKSKAPKSAIKGQANVLIFPNLDSGNIAYKLVQRLAGAEAIGPIVQGLKKPVNDLSRGCDVDDIVNVAAITAIQSKSQ